MTDHPSGFFLGTEMPTAVGSAFALILSCSLPLGSAHWRGCYRSMLGQWVVHTSNSKGHKKTG